jgi:hypothetical protein
MACRRSIEKMFTAQKSKAQPAEKPGKGSGRDRELERGATMFSCYNTPSRHLVVAVVMTVVAPRQKMVALYKC